MTNDPGRHSWGASGWLACVCGGGALGRAVGIDCGRLQSIPEAARYARGGFGRRATRTPSSATQHAKRRCDDASTVARNSDKRPFGGHRSFSSGKRQVRQARASADMLCVFAHSGCQAPPDNLAAWPFSKRKTGQGAKRASWHPGVGRGRPRAASDRASYLLPMSPLSSKLSFTRFHSWPPHCRAIIPRGPLP